MSTTIAIYDQEYLKQQYQDIFSLKSNDFFALLDMEITLTDLLFFNYETAILGELGGVDSTLCREVGLISTLCYLSTKVHFCLQPTAEEDAYFANKVSFPILLGDLLYGKLVERLSACRKEGALALYLAYLKEANAAIVDYFAAKLTIEELNRLLYQRLAVLTAEFMGINNPNLLAMAAQSAQCWGADLWDEPAPQALSAEAQLLYASWLHQSQSGTSQKISCLDELLRLV